MNEAEKCIAFIEQLKVPKGSSENATIKLMPWQHEFVTELLRRNASGLRQYTKAQLWIPKKNGKSSLVAALAVYFLIFSKEVGTNIVCAANTREQASIVFEAAASMIRTNPYLDSVCKVLDSKKLIRFNRTSSTIKAISADAGDKNGLDSSIVIYDEIAEAPNGKLYSALKSGQAARKEPLFITMSTAGDTGNMQSIGYELYKEACKIRDKEVESSSTLVVVYEASPDDDPLAVETYKKCNPSWGITVNDEFIKGEIAEAKLLPSRLYDLRRYHANIWVDKAIAWIPITAWKALAAPIDVASLKGKRCFVGVDLAATSDIAAVVALFFDEEGNVTVLCWFFLPSETADKRAKKDGVKYPHWIKEGHIIATDSKGITDYDAIKNHVKQLAEDYDVISVGIDPWTAPQMITQLRALDLPVKEVRQGFKSLTPPSKEFERLIISKKIRHNDNPVMNWMIGNVVAVTDAADSLKPDKKKSTEKIDGVMALIDALAVALEEGTAGEQSESIYENQGLTFFK